MTKLTEAERGRRASLRKAQKEAKTRDYSKGLAEEKKPSQPIKKPKRNVSGYWKLVNEVKSRPQTGKTRKENLEYSRRYIKLYVKQTNKVRRGHGEKPIDWKYLDKQVKANNRKGIKTLPDIES